MGLIPRRKLTPLGFALIIVFVVWYVGYAPDSLSIENSVTSELDNENGNEASASSPELAIKDVTTNAQAPLKPEADDPVAEAPEPEALEVVDLEAKIPEAGSSVAGVSEVESPEAEAQEAENAGAEAPEAGPSAPEPPEAGAPEVEASDAEITKAGSSEAGSSEAGTSEAEAPAVDTTTAEPEIPNAESPSSDPPAIDDQRVEAQDELAPAVQSQGTYRAGKWDFKERYPVQDYIALPTGSSTALSRLQYDFSEESDDAKSTRLERLSAVETAFKRSWDSYKEHAWMKDELSPLTGGSASTFGGWAATLVDTLDSLWIMGMKEEFEEAVNAVKDIDFTISDLETLNVFETTIRYLGGFLGAYDISDGKYGVLLQKAVEVGDLLYCAFDTLKRMPITRWNWMDTLSGEEQYPGENTLVAEIGSLTLEFTRLSQITGNSKYFDGIQRITDKLDEAQSQTKLPGLWPTVINAKLMTFHDTGFTLGAMADSLYEYFPKQYLLLGGNDQAKRMFDAAMNTAKEHVFFRPLVPDDKDILLSGDVHVNEISADDKRIVSVARSQHLACFTGGMMGIGAKAFENSGYMEIARKLVDGCVWAYDSMPSGIMPEVFNVISCDVPGDCSWNVTRWHEAILAEDQETPQFQSTEEKLGYLIEKDKLMPGFVSYSATSYGLRPEAIESVFVHYRLTGENDLLDAAWRMFTAIEEQTKSEYAYAMISDVRVKNSDKVNKMESFWMAETLKYFYLIFSEPDVVSLDHYVL